MRFPGKYRPHTDLGILFEAALAETKALALSPSECMDRFKHHYRCRTQLPGSEQKEPICGDYLDAAALLKNRLEQLQLAHQVALRSIWPSVARIVLTVVVGSLLLTVFSPKIYVLLMMPWVVVVPHLVVKTHRFVLDRMYRRELSELLRAADLLGENLPDLELPEPARPAGYLSAGGAS